jgi:hypothetical protein
MSRLIIRTPGTGSSTLRDRRTSITVYRGATALTDSTQSPVHYIGWTEDGNTYYITRITLNMNLATTAEAVGSWADRYSLIYT